MNNHLTLSRILIYQDEDCSTMVEYLQLHGFNTIKSTEANVFKKIKDHNYDLCILSHYNTSIPGDLRLLKFLRGIDKKIPVIFVSDVSKYEYVIEAFNAGVDDYIIKPYNFEELICRIKAILRRCGIKVRAIENTYKIGNYIFDTQNNLLSMPGIEIKLTNKESKILALLCAYRNELLLKELLMQQVWADDNYFSRRSLDVHMCALRNYFKMDNRISIETKRGVGYSLVVTEN